ncbi:DUF6262 family protein [Acidithrix sp. C25]|uniref:DUF6262 family protein n=1 Tax=Acidithrix sp. C25 TaxID=1671482 RepID=UPI00191BC9C2|nr:DUF6262 family protein [Acidithrix sp. C25]CAG4933596.1 unnamed protein product [Acidithrix sp. C25]
MTSPEVISKVEQACRELVDEGKVVSFVEVARRIGITRNRLYRNEELRATVTEYRNISRDVHTFLGLSAEISHLRTAVEVLADNVRRHEEQIRRLSREDRYRRQAT